MKQLISQTESVELKIQIADKGQENWHVLEFKTAYGKTISTLSSVESARETISGAMVFEKEHPEEVRQHDYRMVNRITETKVFEEVVK